MALNIIDFINARLDDDEQIAMAAGECNRSDYRKFGEWTFDDGVAAEEERSQREYGGRIRFTIHSTVHGMQNYIRHSGNPHLYNPEMEHLARHDPARVLREVAAKREVLDVCKHVHGHVSGNETADNLAESVLMSLANAWSTHADFKPEWAV
ncbi:DUF6221 family protein [Rhodococcus qingshengii]|uniref:DUF6221 family protein n=1 Tax=Rhodococcus TaxID=1827 RepID=UPI001E2E2CDE|nr:MULTISPECIES: DUF6221 family protein [Rhodococcus]MCD2099572.1 DUF6221 family protein [Rhodococcus rhodochrous]MCD2123940.1 DUF6221 family protein [Rhodococcus rhodochrous]MCQ4136631.1 DUF6221 family protein [Rhodococcus rhodochrous]MDJ0490583.1 DUF6221 family protein [Rhodococcus qingshengii]